jgi:hypothetical protein
LEQLLKCGVVVGTGQYFTCFKHHIDFHLGQLKDDAKQRVISIFLVIYYV